MRHPIGVAMELKDIVPDEYKGKFDELIESFSYKAPEQMKDCFGMLAVLVNWICPQEKLLEVDTWEIKMVSVLTTKSEEKLLEEQDLRGK